MPFEACLASGLVGVLRGLWTLDQELAEDVAQEGDGSVVLKVGPRFRVEL